MKKNFVLYTVIVVLAIGLIYLFYQNQQIMGKLALLSEKQGIQQASEEKILEKLFNHEEMKGFRGEEAKITKLAETDLKTLKQKMPVVYGNATKEDLEVRFKELLVIYDPKNDEIKKMFKLQDLTFTP